MNFSNRLLQWYQMHARALPWRGQSDPYYIWVSEVILQQTRVDQGVSYYHKFIEAFPDIKALAVASEEEVLRIWQGLGYYSRARNMHQAARQVVFSLGGKMPQTSKELLNLKGVGHYTAAAVASIAFGEAVPALDGNVFRVLARIFAVNELIDTGKGQKVFHDMAVSLLPANDPGLFNQAMMDFGSMICKPIRPLCQHCLFQRECIARQRNAVNDFPRRRKKKAARKRFFHYFLFAGEQGDGGLFFFVHQRQGADIWKNLYEYPLLEASDLLSAQEIVAHPWWTSKFPHDDQIVFVGEPHYIKHQLTHQTISAVFFQLRVDSGARQILETYFRLVSPSEFQQLPKPVLVERLSRRVECG